MAAQPDLSVRGALARALEWGITPPYPEPAAIGQVYNVAVGDRTTLNQLHARVAAALRGARPDLRIGPPAYREFRPGDVRHSQADVGKARRLLGYAPTHDVAAGLAQAIGWYVGRFSAPSAANA